MLLRDRSRRCRAKIHCLLLEALEPRRMFSFGLTTSTNSYTVDVGANLVFAINRTTALGGSIGDMTSMKYNGTELEASYSATSRYSHYESGLGSGTVVTATTDPSGNWILITCNDLAGTGVIQYYIARKGYNNIYLATYAPGPASPSPGEMRYITYTNHAVLVNAPAPSNNTGSTGAIESADVYGFADGTTSSKYYGEYEAVNTQTYGLTGGGFGVYMNIGNRETSSGGPFFKDIDFQTTSTASTELYNYMFSGHSQTENFRPGLQGPYALQFTTGAAPVAPDYSFINGLGLAGWVSPAGRGTLTGTASGVPSGHQVTVALSNATAQYWATPDALTGAYTIAGVKPGDYAETIYQDELAVGTLNVTIGAAATTRANITETGYLELNPATGLTVSTPSNITPIWRIGTWDGTPNGFLNASNITTMHPSDIRMSPWAADATGMTNFIVGTDPNSAFPMAEWHSQMGTGTGPFYDTQNRITFTLTAAQAATALTLRIGVTRLDHGRPNISVNGGAGSATQNETAQPSSRGLTTGNWRGNNSLYSFNISTSSLHAGTNYLDISDASGSAGTLYSGYHVYDAIDLVPTSSLTNAPYVASVAITPANPSVGINAPQTFTAVAKDQFGNVTPANFTWSATRGLIDGIGGYSAPGTAGSDTIIAASGSIQGSDTVTVVSTLMGRNIFYAGSVFDTGGSFASAIASDKTALLPGQTAAFANYTSYSAGINGILVDIAGPAASLVASDFTFRVGNSSSTASWTAAAAPLAVNNLSGSGAGGSTRVELLWSDNVIQGQWLQVTVKGGAGSDSGLAANDVFYFGNAIGETGNTPGSTRVDATDALAARAAATGSAGITNVADFNRDGKVDATDESIALAHETFFMSDLQLITLPAVSGAAVMAASDAGATTAVGGVVPAIGPTAAGAMPAGTTNGAAAGVVLATAPAAIVTLPATTVKASVEWRLVKPVKGVTPASAARPARAAAHPTTRSTGTPVAIRHGDALRLPILGTFLPAANIDALPT